MPFRTKAIFALLCVVAAAAAAHLFLPRPHHPMPPPAPARTGVEAPLVSPPLRPQPGTPDSLPDAQTPRPEPAATPPITPGPDAAMLQDPVPCEPPTDAPAGSPVTMEADARRALSLLRGCVAHRETDAKFFRLIRPLMNAVLRCGDFALPLLTEVLRDPEESADFRTIVARLLQEMANPAAFGVTREVTLNSAEPEQVRAATLMALHGTGLPEAGAVLRSLATDDESPLLRRAAITHLKDYPSLETVNVLRRTVRSSVVWEQMASTLSLMALAKNMKETADAEAPVLAPTSASTTETPVFGETDSGSAETSETTGAEAPSTDEADAPDIDIDSEDDISDAVSEALIESGLAIVESLRAAGSDAITEEQIQLADQVLYAVIKSADKEQAADIVCDIYELVNNSKVRLDATAVLSSFPTNTTVQALLREVLADGPLVARMMAARSLLRVTGGTAETEILQVMEAETNAVLRNALSEILETELTE